MTETEQLITLDDDGDVSMPVVDVLTGRAFITGKSGSGKSNTASVVIEELLDLGFPALIVDTDGEYWGLKEEYEVLHVGADDECDLQVGPEHATKLAELSLEDNVPIILDVSGYLDSDEADELVRRTAECLFHKEKKLNKPFLLLVEECHEYLPQSGTLDDVGETLVQVTKRGRKRGLGVCGISQRPASVDKDFITQCEWLVWHRLTWNNDTDVVRKVIDAEHADAVQDLDDGEAFLMADFLEADIQRVQMRRKRTFDAGETPDLNAVEQPDLKSVGGDLVDELEEISEQEERRQDRIAELEGEVEAREETIEELREELDQARDMTEMAEQFSEAMMQSAGEGSSGGEALQKEIEDIRDEKNSRINELEQQNEALRDDLRDANDEISTLQSRLADLEEYERAVENMDELREAAIRMNDALGIDAGGDDQLRQKLQQKQDRIDDLQSQVSRLKERAADDVEVPTEYEDFVDDEVVQEAIEDATENCSSSPRYIKGVIAAIIEESGPVNYETVADYLGVSTTSDVSKASSALQAASVVKKVEERPAKIDFNLDGIRDIKQQNRRRERAETIMDEL